MAAVKECPGLHRKCFGLTVTIPIRVVNLEGLRGHFHGLLPLAEPIRRSRESDERQGLAASILCEPAKPQRLPERGQRILGPLTQQLRPAETEGIRGGTPMIG